MPSYAYRAVHISGRVSRGEMAAANENELADYLSQSGFELIHAREKQKPSSHIAFLRASVPPRCIASFCMRMHDLLQSGIIFPDALRDVTETTENRTMAGALGQILHALSNGTGIADSFTLSHLFSPLFIAIVGAGETSGDMTHIFSYLATHTENTAKNAEKTRRALHYPVFLFLVAGSAVLFMMVMVIPQIVQFLNGIQGHLPFSTRLLVALSSLFTNYGLTTASILILSGGVIYIAKKTIPSFALFCDAVLLRLPFIGNLITKISLARFTHSFAILFDSGCTVRDCMNQSTATLSNRALQQGMRDASEKITSGASLSLALAGIMPRYAIGLLRIGERSGNLNKSLHDISTTYEREAQEASESFIGILEPVLTLAIGAILAWTVIAVLGPLYGSLSVLGGRM